MAGLTGGMPRVQLASVLHLLAALGVFAVCLGAGGVPRASAQASVMAWGENSDGQLGNGSFPGPEGCFVAYCSRTPVTVTGLGAVAALAGGSQGLALLGDGTVMAWGSNAEGQLGNGSRERSDVPVPVPGLSGVTAIAASRVGMALLSNGTVMDWGEDDDGQLGNGTTVEAVTTPVQVSGLSEVTAIAAGGGYSLALLRNGTVMTWGESGGANNSDVPVQVSGLSGVTAIAAAGGHSLALLSNGKVMAWGENEYGELGDGDTKDSQTPVLVKGLSEVVAISEGASHNLALLADGTVMAWGQNDWGQLGDGFDSGEGAENGPETCGPTSCSTIPVPVSGLRGVAAIATGSGQSLALLDDGTVMSWGENFEGQLANGSGETGSDVPVPVSGLSGATEIAAGAAFSMAELHGETGYISGRVTSAVSGEAIAGADACAAVANGTGSWRCAATDTGGNYTIAVHGGGAYEVRFWAPSGGAYVSNVYYDGKHSSAEADTVAVQSGLTTSGIDAQLATGGRIEGTVTSAATKAPLEGVEVCAPAASSGCALTNGKGEYVISELQEGEYKVQFSVADGTYHSQYREGKQSIGEGQLVPVAAGQAAAGVNAELEPASGAITGTVRDNETNSAIKGIGVCAYKVGEEEEKLFGQCTTTSSTGAYSILGLAGGEYIVEFYSPADSRLLYATEYYDGKYSALNAETVHVVIGEHTANIDAALEAGGNIAGKVTSAVDGSPIEGIEVCFFATTEELVGCTITDAQGAYGTPLLARGTYKVEFTPPLGSDLNYVAQYFDGASASSAAQWVSVAAGATTSGIDAALAEGGRISGTVTHEETHTPIADALVCAFTPQARIDACSITTSTGDYTIVGLAGGAYKVGFDGGEPYVVQYYDDKSAFAGAQTVTVAVGDTTPGVDAALESADRPEEPGSTARAPVNTSRPVISGTDAVGEVLTCADGSWTGTPTPRFSVRWLRDGSPIVEAATNSYTVLSADEGHRLACEVTASNTAGEKSAVSAGVPIPTSSTAHVTTGGSATTSGATSTASTSPTAATAPASDWQPMSPSIAILSSTLAVSGSSLLAHVRCGVGKACAGTVELLMQVEIKRHAGRRTISHEVVLVLARGSVSHAGDGENASIVLHLTTVGKRRLVNVGRRRPVAAELRLAVPSGKTIARPVQIT